MAAAINYRAYQILPMLMFAANRSTLVTYHELYKCTGLIMPSIGKALEIIRDVCTDCNLPDITSIVVRKYDGVPGERCSAENPQEEMMRAFNYDWYNIITDDEEGIINKCLSYNSDN